MALVFCSRNSHEALVPPMAKHTRQKSLAGFDDLDSDIPPKTTQSEPQTPDQSAPLEDSTTAVDLQGKSVYVVDAHALLYQVFYALPDMTSPNGLPVGAIFGFTRDMVDLLERKRPDHLICAFDHPGDTFRHQLFGEYKSNRDAMPEDLRPQIANVQRMLDAMGIPWLSLQTFEADDLLATVAHQTEILGGKCFLVTSDKDCRQLISDNTFMYNIRKDAVMDAAALHEDWGIRPDQVVDFQSLWGDSTDNIPGVEGIGPKTARDLLAQYDTLEGVLDNAEKVKAKKRRENLLNGREKAFLSRELVQLSRNVPITVNWQASRVGGIDEPQISTLCREFGFRTLSDRLCSLSTKDAPQEWKTDYRLVASCEQLDALVEDLSKQKQISIDTETTSTNPRWAEIVGYSFSWQEGMGVYVAVRSPPGEPSVDPQYARDALRPILEDPSIKKIGQNLKYDIVVLRNDGTVMQGTVFDTMVADYLLESGERNHGLDELAKRYLNHTNTKISELIGKGKNQKRMDEVSVELVKHYACEDADVPLRLEAILKPRLADSGFQTLFTDLEIPLIDVLAEMEFNGIAIDVPVLQRLSVQYGQRMEALQNEIFELAGSPFNIDSPKQLSKVLFDDLELPIIKKTKTGASTDVEVLTQLAQEHELPAKIIEYRQNAKLKSTYVDALPELVHPETGRVHTSFRQDVTATGRLSSTEPNLQNIPVRTDASREIRSAFIPGESGWNLMTVDYSQIELRVLAHFCEDKTLRQAFLDNQDIHALVASEVYAVPLDAVTREMRRSAKAINFGIIYGQSPFGLAKALDIATEDAADFIEAYFSRYSGVEEFIKRVLEDCARNGYVSTALGRKRPIQGIRPISYQGDSRQRNLPERIAINTVIQGTAADLIKQAMIKVHARMHQEKLSARMLLQIHDELIFEAPSQELTHLSQLVTEEMTTVGNLSVPLTVDVKVGSNWAECEPLT